ncbi:hypothetical protein ACP_1965 [Acidobacterium capsulatum ATCC 51196]|uniref:Uncharacterized protein n=1 Tax=Acidobacterium capsulatum (strain ATCC 51196 / DSM 11244 / BCRC 80197 / JCM 7670 / NBRC 15755 / NCIMB 13165 / 161) TaxID=240015 RepID=C1F8F3_ACIC5|nr:hypothetical protein ACP_1965 [Acidobacterium capsulatum ATCC 51196]
MRPAVRVRGRSWRSGHKSATQMCRFWPLFASAPDQSTAIIRAGSLRIFCFAGKAATQPRI